MALIMRLGGIVWYAPALLLVVLMTALLVPLGGSWMSVDGALWAHLLDTQMMRLVGNSLGLVAAVLFGTMALALPLAWLCACADFPGRRFFSWALVMPFAMPTYVLAFVVLGVFDFDGPVQRLLGARLDVRSPWMLAAVMSLALYPYLYLPLRAALATQGRDALCAARNLGCGPLAALWRVVLPLAAPAMLAGASLVALEVLGDFGAVAVFNYDSFTTAIYKSWLDFGSLATATQLASLLFLFAMLMMLAGQYAGRRTRHHAGGARMPRMQLRPALRLAACGFCTLVFALAVALPLLQLLAWALSGAPALRPGALANSLLLAAATSLGLVFLALCFLAAPRGRSRVLGEICGLGYALPGSVLAVAVLILLGWVDGLFGVPLLLGSAAGLILAYMVRFFRLGYGPLAASMAQIPPCLHEAAATLGASPWRRLHSVVAPLLGRGLAVALLLVFVEVLKEMPATLLLRPFGWDTLAVQLYAWTSEGQWRQAAWPALVLVCAGLVPVLLLARSSSAQDGRAF